MILFTRTLAEMSPRFAPATKLSRSIPFISRFSSESNIGLSSRNSENKALRVNFREGMKLLVLDCVLSTSLVTRPLRGQLFENSARKSKAEGKLKEGGLARAGCGRFVTLIYD